MKIGFRSKFILFLIVLTWEGCKDNGIGSGAGTTSGSATINTRYVENTSSGFSFDRATVIRFPNALKLYPDISVLVQIAQEGEILGVFFARPDSFVPAFRMMTESSSIDSAESYFQNLVEIPDTTFLPLALEVRVGQVWAVKTRRRTFAKILIRQTIAYQDSTTIFGEATFDWVYQPNGTRRF